MGEKQKNKDFLSFKRTIIFRWFLIFIVIFLLGAFFGYYYYNNQNTQKVQEKDVYISFLFEVYDKIQENYWDNITDQQLTQLYRLAGEKLTGFPQRLESNDKKGLKKILIEMTKGMDKKQKKEFTVQLSNIVLANLNPFGRSGLYTTKDEENLKNKVQNKDPNADLYKDLGVNKNASKEEVKQVYEKKNRELNQISQDQNQPQEKRKEAEKQIAQINRAYDTLSFPEKKENYDKFGVESTTNYKLIGPNIFYILIKQLSPLTLDEFQKAAESVNNQPEGLNSLIIDLRGNIGGTIDILPYFLGPFIGQDQYAFDFFHKGDSTPFKTKIGFIPSLVRYKKVIILVDNKTQSSAEVMAATFKKYNIGVVIGIPTKGWGTVEKVFSLDQQIDPGEKYSMFLVHSLTLREDNQPIEGKGVDPTINLNDIDWEKKLYAYFGSTDLIKAVKELIQVKTN